MINDTLVLFIIMYFFTMLSIYLIVCFFSLRQKRKSNASDENGLKNRVCAILDVVVKIIPIITLFTVFWGISTLNGFKQFIKVQPISQLAIAEWKDELSHLRIGYSKEYIESNIGKPQLISEITFEQTKFEKCIYVNNYFSIICIYRSDLSLFGYLIIGNDENFSLENYRCNIKLFDYTINQAEEYCFDNGVQSILYLANNNGQRLDTNSYYFECNLQHSKGGSDFFIIGYGICDIGAISLYDDFYDAILAMRQRGERESYPEFYERSKDDEIRNFPINSFLILDGNEFDDFAVNFIQEALVTSTSLGMTWAEYANTQTDYMGCIDDYLAREFPENIE